MCVCVCRGGGVSLCLVPEAAVERPPASSGKRGCSHIRWVLTCGLQGCQRTPQLCGAPHAARERGGGGGGGGVAPHPQ